MSPRKRTTPKPAPVISEVDLALVNGVRHQQRAAVYGVPANAPTVDDTMPPTRLHGEDGHDVVRLVEQFREVGRQWALTGHLVFGALAPTYAEVVENEGEPLSFKASFLGIGATNGGYSVALAERYLREAGLEHEVSEGEPTPIELLLNRRNWLTQLHAIRALRTDIPAERRERFRIVGEQLFSVINFLGNCELRADAITAGAGFEYVEPPLPAWLTEAQAQELGAYARKKTMTSSMVFGLALERDLAAELPFFSALLSERHELREECERPATLEDVDAWTLTRADGTLAPSPEAWLATLAANGELHHGDAAFLLTNGLEALASNARKAREAELTARAEKAERALER